MSRYRMMTLPYVCPLGTLSIVSVVTIATNAMIIFILVTLPIETFGCSSTHIGVDWMHWIRDCGLPLSDCLICECHCSVSHFSSFACVSFLEHFKILLPGVLLADC